VQLVFVKSVLKSLEFNFWRVAVEEVTIQDGEVKERGEAEGAGLVQPEEEKAERGP